MDLLLSVLGWIVLGGVRQQFKLVGQIGEGLRRVWQGWSAIALGLLSVCLLSMGLLSVGLLSLPAQALPLHLTLDAAPVLMQSGSVEELRRQQQQIQQKRQSVIQERDRLKNLEKAANQRLQGLQQSVQVTTIQIQDYEFQLEVAKQKLQGLQQDLAQAEKDYQQQQFATVARLQYLQRQQVSRGWAVLLQSQNLNQFLDRRRQLKQVYESDRQSLVRLKAAAEAINRQRLEVEDQKNKISLLTQQLLAQKAQFEAEAQTQSQLINRLRADRTALEAAEAQLLRDSQGLSTLIQQKVAEQRAKEAAQAAAAQAGRATAPIVVRGTGQMSYPSDGPITSSFGWRVHPILGYRRFHAGIDFGVDYGSTIRAADQGTVIFAGWYGGYGNAVIIDHGGGITTLYGHSSELFVSEGQTVQKGQAIAAVGSSGLSTGPHLHFEVRKDGEPVDPMGYL